MNRDQLLERVNQLSPEHLKLLADKLDMEPKQTPGSAQLVAYICSKSSVDVGALKHHLGENLPNHMIPNQIVTLKEMPKLPNGKIDLKALPLTNDLNTSEAGKQEASSNLEIKLVEIWQEVLGSEPVGITDNFFEIGGDSILSIQIVAKAREAGIIFAPNQLFQYQTIAELVKVIEQTSETTDIIEPAAKSQTGNSSTTDISPEDMNMLMEQINQQRSKE